MALPKFTYKYTSQAIDFDRPLSHSKIKISEPPYRIAKRILDILFSLLLLTLVAPWLFLIVCIVIIIDSKGSPLFIQKRTGRNRKVFHCIKFRTMIPNTEANRLQVQEDDVRITKVGHFLRRHHIDELPQIINILIGDMSLVGPRPYMIRQDIELSKLSSNHNLRYKVKPGLTGLAQVRGYYGSILDEKDYFNRLNSDMEYIYHWSILMDVDIFARTLFQKLFNLE